MLIETPGGFDYTGADCRGWMREAGFRETLRRASGRSRLDGGRDQVSGAEGHDGGGSGVYNVRHRVERYRRVLSHSNSHRFGEDVTLGCAPAVHRLIFVQQSSEER